ncbi:MAG: hypothetical protein J6V38_02845 [Kiritimatiellae bacterium]|nr:hypothetical protein [Kiritimatiellia bacterium]
MEQNINTEALEVITPAAAATAMIAEFETGIPSFFCSFRAETVEEKAALYNAMNAPDVQIADHIGQTINMRDIIIEAVDMVNEESGELRTVPRCTIIDVEGNSYASTSAGIYNALRKIAGIFGKSHFEAGLPVRVQQLSLKGGRRTYTLNLAV